MTQPYRQISKAERARLRQQARAQAGLPTEPCMLCESKTFFKTEGVCDFCIAFEVTK